MNPISYARNLELLSSGALSKKLKISRQYLNRVEQGLYQEPNKKLLDWAAEILTKNRGSGKPITSDQIMHGYRAWQWEHRRLSKDALAIKPITITDLDRMRQTGRADAHPSEVQFYKFFNSWREGYWYTVHNFCVDFCLHPDPVNTYEDGESYKMPKQLREVMEKLELVGDGFDVTKR